jgi:hypothetical protein
VNLLIEKDQDRISIEYLIHHDIYHAQLRFRHVDHNALNQYYEYCSDTQSDSISRPTVSRLKWPTYRDDRLIENHVI